MVERVVLGVAVLLAGLGSVVVVLKAEEGMRIEVVAGVESRAPLMTIVELAPGAIVPRLVEPVQAALGPPSTLNVAPDRPAGRLSLTVTAWASDGPLLVIVAV